MFNQINLTKYYHSFVFFVVVFLLVWLPFNALLNTFLNYKLGFSFVPYLKEVLVVLLLAHNLFFLKKDFWVRRIFWLVVGFCGLVVLSLMWSDGAPQARLLYGFKYEAFFLVVLVTFMSLPEFILAKREQLLKTALISGIVAVTLGLLMHFVVGPANLTTLGYRNDWSTYYVGQAPAFCQRVEDSAVCRFQGTFSGPNQAGANIVMYFALLLPFLFKKNKWALVALIPLLLGLFFTFSRSAWLAFILLMLLTIAWNKEFRKYLVYLVGLGFVAGLVTLAVSPELLVRFGSNSERLQKMYEGVKIALQNPLIGQGVATAGPASRFIGHELITENWFLQVAINYGLVGLGLFISLYYSVTKALLKNRELMLGILFVALLIPLNLLHSFEDSSLAYTLFALSGLFLAKH